MYPTTGTKAAHVHNAFGVDARLWHFVFGWTKGHWNRRDFQTVCRVAFSGWVALLFLLIVKTQEDLFGGAYLLGMLCWIIPPAETVASYIEQAMVALLLNSLLFAYNTFVIEVAWLSRRKFKISLAQFNEIMQSEGRMSNYSVQETVFSGRFIEAGPSIITVLLAGLALGSLLWFRGRVSHTHHATPTISAIFMICIPLSSATLYPYPYYKASLQVFIPFLLQLGINLFSSLLIFPETLHSSFLRDFIDIIDPLMLIVHSQQSLLASDPQSKTWHNYSNLEVEHAHVLDGLLRLEKTRHLLQSEIHVRRLGSQDTKRLLRLLRKLAVNSSGFFKFHTLILRHITQAQPAGDQDPTLNNFALHMPSREGSPTATPPPARSRVNSRQNRTAATSPTALLSRFPTAPHQQTVTSHAREDSGRSSLTQVSATSLLDGLLRHHQRTAQDAVGIYMSNRYHELENLISRPEDVEILEEMLVQLRTKSAALREAIYAALSISQDVLSDVQRTPLLGRVSKTHTSGRVMVEKAKAAMQQLSSEIDLFEQMRVSMLHSQLHTRQHDTTYAACRALYWTQLYQYSLLRVAQLSTALLDTAIGIQQRRTGSLTISAPSFRHLWDGAFGRTDEVGMDESPEHIDGADASHRSNARDPDRLPPRNVFQDVGYAVHHILLFFTRRNTLFAAKAALLHAALLSPAFIPAYSLTYFRIRAVWAVILSAMTFTRFVGDTIHGFSMRVIGSAIGAALGLLVWEISRGNPYGLAAVTAFAYFPLSFFRIFHPSGPLTIVILTTYALVIGFSYQNEVNPLVDTASGFTVAWRRFVLATIGLTVSFVAAYFPPRWTEKQSIRAIYSTTSRELGMLFCDVISCAHREQSSNGNLSQLLTKMYGVRRKLRQASLRKSFIPWEIPFYGHWPNARYDDLDLVSKETIAWVALLVENLQNLSKPWRNLFIQNAKLQDLSFVGHVINALHISSIALKSGMPMPSFYTPVLEIFLTTAASRTELDIPVLDSEAVASFEYLELNVALTSFHAIINRIDRLVFICKELCGESFRIEELLGTISKQPDIGEENIVDEALP